MPRPHTTRSRSGLVAAFPLLATVLVFLALGPSLRATEIAPLRTGPHEVATTYLEVRADTEKPVIDYLQGTGGIFTATRYLTDILVTPSAAFSLEVKVPENRPAFGSLVGKRFPALCYIVYPTTKDNPRPTYTFPYTNTGDNVFTHMQRPGDKPLLAEPGKRYPLILCSHGWTAHGLWELDRYKHLASHGYIVVSIFHGDNRYGFDDSLILRPVTVSQVIDKLLTDPDFSQVIDPERIGVSGSSLGAHTTFTLLGATNAGAVGTTLQDPRLKAGFTLVPFLGGFLRWPFGRDLAGLATMNKPLLAVYATQDTQNAETLAAATAKGTGEFTTIELPGEGHLVSKAGWNDIPTWELLFWNAHLKDDPEARALLRTDLQVTGGTPDHKSFQRLP